MKIVFTEQIKPRGSVKTTAVTKVQMKTSDKKRLTNANTAGTGAAVVSLKSELVTLSSVYALKQFCGRYHVLPNFKSDDLYFETHGKYDKLVVYAKTYIQCVDKYTQKPLNI